MSTLKIPIEFDFDRVSAQLKDLVRKFDHDAAPSPPLTPPLAFGGPKYLPGQIVIARQVACVVTNIRPPNAAGVRLYDVITLDGSRHLYTDEPEPNLRPDVPLMSIPFE